MEHEDLSEKLIKCYTETMLSSIDIPNIVAIKNKLLSENEKITEERVFDFFEKERCCVDYCGKKHFSAQSELFPKLSEIKMIKDGGLI